MAALKRQTLILSEHIPLTANVFVAKCTDDVLKGRYAPGKDYRGYVIQETQRLDKHLLAYLRVPDSENRKTQYDADVDHIIPRDVWRVLMFGFLGPPSPALPFNILSNLFWRDMSWNRGMDQEFIKEIHREAKTIPLSTTAGRAWRTKWIEIFLRTKHDEGMLFPGQIMDQSNFNEMIAEDGESNFLNRG